MQHPEIDLCTLERGYTSFKWSNLASNKAGVTVAIVGVGSTTSAPHRLYEHDEHGGVLVREGASITPYLTLGPRVIVEKRDESISDLSVMEFGNKPSDGGQVQRAANRFALIAAAGEVAVDAGVLPWPTGVATDAAGRCFRDWLQARGGTEPPEVRDGIEQVRAFLVAYGMSRFVPAWAESVDGAVATSEIAGFRKQEGDGWDYYVTTGAWRQICVDFNPQLISAVLAERGMLVVPDARHRAKSIKVPGHNKLRLYHLRAAFLEGESD